MNVHDASSTGAVSAEMRAMKAMKAETLVQAKLEGLIPKWKLITNSFGVKKVVSGGLY